MIAPAQLACLVPGPSVLAWTPFLQPAPGVQHWWWLLVLPMALGVAMAYKAIRVRTLAEWPGGQVADGAVPVDVTGHSSADGDMRMSVHELGLYAQPPR
jgi:hypothetical protein